MDPPFHGFDRVVISCVWCGHRDVLDLQAGVMTPKRLRREWLRCSLCGSREIEVTAHSPAPDRALARDLPRSPGAGKRGTGRR